MKYVVYMHTELLPQLRSEEGCSTNCAEAEHGVDGERVLVRQEHHHGKRPGVPGEGMGRPFEGRLLLHIHGQGGHTTRLEQLAHPPP